MLEGEKVPFIYREYGTSYQMLRYTIKPLIVILTVELHVRIAIDLSPSLIDSRKQEFAYHHCITTRNLEACTVWCHVTTWTLAVKSI